MTMTIAEELDEDYLAMRELCSYELQKIKQ